MLRHGFTQRLLLALVLAAVGSGIASAGASAWTPAVTVSGATIGADAPSVGIAADQSSVLAWKHAGFASSLVQARSRSAAGAWGPVVNVSSGDQPALAVNAAGTAAIVWRHPSAFGDRIELTLRSPDGSLAPTEELSVAGVDADTPDVGIAADGTVVAVWRQSDGADDRVQLRVRRADGTLDPVQAVSTPGAPALGPVVKVAPSGAAAAVWRRTLGPNTGVEFASVSPAGAVGATLKPAIAGVSQSPDVGVDDAGDAIVVWQRPDATTDRVQMRTVSAGGALGALKLLSSAASAATQPAMAVSPSGDAVIAWRSLEAGSQRIRALQRSSGGVIGSRELLSSAGVDARSPDVDLSDDGRAVVVWDRPSPITNIQARSLFADGSKSSLATVGTTSAPAPGKPVVDVNNTGGSALGWLRYDGSSTRVRASFGAPDLGMTAENLAHSENETQIVDGGLTIADDDQMLSGATMAITANYLPEDGLGFTDQSGITGEFDASNGVLTLSGSATVAEYQTALRSVTYHDSSDTPSTATRTITVQVSDGASDSATASRKIEVSAADDAPVLETPGAVQTYNEGGAAVPPDATLTVTDVDSTEMEGATAVIGGYVSGDRLNFTDQSTITGAFDVPTRTLTLGGIASVADYQTALRSVTFDSTSGTPGNTSRTIVFTVTDAEATTSATDSQDVDVTPGNDPPTAGDRDFNAVTNTPLRITLDGAPASGTVTGTGTLADSISDPDGSTGLAVIAETVTSVNGGTAAINADGSFAYRSATGDTEETDTFAYRAQDGAGAIGSGTVTITLTERLWYVDSGAAADGDGTVGAPFTSVPDALAAAGWSDTIYVKTGTGGTIAGVTLQPGQKLIGQGEALRVDLGGSGVPSGHQTVLAAGGKPKLVAGLSARVVTLASGSAVRSLQIDPPGGGGGILANGAVVGSTIADVDVSDTGSLGTSPGVDLTNSRGTFDVSNLTVATNGVEALRASNAGTLTVTGSASTLAATGATALRVAGGTTIGAAGLTFQSISSSGAPNGIFLDHTGAGGGLTVTGTGTSGTGGTLATTSGADGATAGNGVYLNTTAGVSLRSMSIHDHPNYAIKGIAVNGFELRDSVVDGTNGNLSGNGASEQEAAVAFTGLTGTAAITGNTISGGRTENVRIVNSSGALGTLTLTGNVVQDNVGDVNKLGDGVWVQATGTATIANANISNNTIRRVKGFSVHVQALDSAQVGTTIAGNTIRGGHPTQAYGGILVDSSNQEYVPASPSPSFNGTVGYTITGNDIQGVSAGSAITSSKGHGTSTFRGTIADNVVGDPLVNGSGASQSLGIFAQAYGAGDHIVAITGNQIRQVSQIAIQASAGVGPVNMDATVTGNSVTNPSAAAISSGINSFNLNTGITSATSPPTVCLDLGGAGALANSFSGIGTAGQADIRVRERFATVLNLRGYGGGSTDTAAVNAWAIARNSANGTPTASSTVGTVGFANTAAGAACRQP